MKVPVHVAPPVGVAAALDTTDEEEETGLAVEETLTVEVTEAFTDEEDLTDVARVELGFAEDLVEVFTAVSARHCE